METRIPRIFPPVFAPAIVAFTLQCASPWNSNGASSGTAKGVYDPPLTFLAK